MFEFFKTKRLETISFFVLLIFWGIMAVFHEPWYDELQAWQIAKVAYWKDIFFSIPHYEGHPPLWYIILALPARLGMPVEWGLKAVGFVFSSAAAFLIIFKSPFPRWLRCTIPFTYFLFFQYSVIVRPYAVMYVSIILAAIAFAYKDKHPGWFVGVLALLTAVHAYGLAVAGGLCLAWLWDIKNQYGSVGTLLKNALHDKRMYWLVGLLVLAVGVVCVIWPRPDSLAINLTSHKSPLWNRVIYAFFMLPADAFFSDAWGLKGLSVTNYFRWEVIVPTVFIGLVVWCCLGLFVPKKHLKYLLLPSFFFLSMVAFGYAAHHHIGIFVFIVLFVAWISCRDVGSCFWGSLAPRMTEHVQKIWKKTFQCVLFIAVATGIVWTSSNMIVDICEPFASSRSIARFVEQHKLDQGPIFASWMLVKQGKGPFFQQIFHMNGIMVSAYFDHPIIYNLNDGEKHLVYSSHKWPTKEDITFYFAKWRGDGLPEVLLGREGFSSLFPYTSFYMAYAPVYKAEHVVLWKMHLAPWRSVIYLYVRRDVMNKYNVWEITDEYKESRVDNVTISEK